MKTKNVFWIITGLLTLFTFFLHLIGGQLTIVNPMMGSSMPLQAQTEMLAAWHIVSVVILLSSVYFLRFGFGRFTKSPHDTIKLMSYSYIAFGLVFIMVSLVQGVFAPQWILLAPIGLLGLLGLKKFNSNEQ